MPLRRDRLIEIWHYYQAGIVNTAFGVGLYAFFVWLSLNMYLAQLIAHTLGVGFNYLTYSRHVFRDVGPAKLRFTLSYIVNYLVGLATLAGIAHVIKSPYVAGVLTVGFVSIINYFVLKHFVFRMRARDRYAEQIATYPMSRVCFNHTNRWQQFLHYLVFRRK